MKPSEPQRTSLESAHAGFSSSIRPFRSYLLRYLPGLVLLLSLALTYIVWQKEIDNTLQHQQAGFDFHTRESLQRIEERLTAYAQMLRGSAGLFTASDNVGRREFAAFVSQLKLDRDYPGIQGIGFALVIPPEEWDRHHQEVRSQGFPAYTVHPEGKRAFHTSIIYLEPFTGRNLRAFGYDMWSEPVRRNAMARARDSGEVAISGKVHLVQETEDRPQAGFLMYLPVFRKGAPISTPAERRANLAGWTYAPFRMNDLMHGIFGGHQAMVDIEIYDTEHPSPDTLMSDTDDTPGSRNQARFQSVRQLMLFGRPWTIAVRSTAFFEQNQARDRPASVAVTGVGISLLLAWITWLLARGHARVLHRAGKMVQKLQETETRYLQMFEEHTSVAVLIDPESGAIADANRAATEFWGYTREELRRMNIRDINTAPPAEIHEKMALVKSHALHHVECRHRLKNGELRDVEIYSGPITHHGKTLLYSLIHDISERKQTAAALRASEQRFRDLVNTTDGIVWEADATTFSFTFVSNMAEKLLGYPIEAWTRPGFWVAHLHPDDQAWAPQYCASCTGRLEPHDFEYRFIAQDGRTVWLRDLVTVVAENGKPRWLRGIMVDISAHKHLENRLTHEKTLLRTLIDSIPDLIFFKDASSVYLGCNKSFEKLYGAQEKDIIGKTDADFVDAETAAFFRTKDQEMLALGHPRINEEWLSYPDGHKMCAETMKTPYCGPDGQVIGLIGVARDITERRANEEDLQLAAIVFDNVDNGVLVTDPDRRILSVNPAFTRLTGYSEEDVLGKDPGILSSHRHPPAFFAEMWSSLSTAGTWSGEVINRRKDGEIYVEWLSITAVRDASGKVTHYVAVFSDITTRKEDEARVQHLAHYDVLTDLPNRALLSDRLHQALAKARREHSRLAVMFLDLDQFKPINDSLGHDMGDLLLRMVAERLQTCVQRESDTVSRLGGDEFVILLQTIETEIDAKTVAEKILLALHQPFDLAGHSASISTSIGIAIYPEHGQTAAELLKNADIAMYHTKRSGPGQYRFFNAITQQGGIEA